MGLNETPSGERIHISIFGKRNAGKSSLANAITGQEMSIVSDVLGTTTDPVKKTMELLPIGPVVIIDTPGLDDYGELGELRVRKTREILNRTDVAVLVIDGTKEASDVEYELIKELKDKHVPYVIAYNKSDAKDFRHSLMNDDNAPVIDVSSSTGENIYALKELIGKTGSAASDSRLLIADLIQPEDYVMLVVPIDSAAPKGRIILPQQQVLRAVLDMGAKAIVVKEDEVKTTISELSVKPSLVVTDSQAFKTVSADVPDDIPLTSFSILMARYKGFLTAAVNGVNALKTLEAGAKILISEGCSHHRQCEDIGTVKLPKWIREYTGKDFVFETSSGNSFPDDLSGYDFVLHCGGCMLNEKEMAFRMKTAADFNVPFTNYGITIAEIHGILERSIRMLPEFKNN